MSDRTVVVPCAGMATRLGLHISKCLLPVAPGRALIDCAMDLVRSLADDCHVVLIARPEQFDIWRYAGELAVTQHVSCVPQVHGLGSLRSGLASAAHAFGTRTVVLLPDQLFEAVPRAGSPLKEAFDVLACEPGVVLAQRESAPERYADDGVVICQEKDRRTCAVAAVDKPQRELSGETWVWAGFGFRPESIHMIDWLLGAPAVVRPWRDATDLPVREIVGYRDLGVWERYVDALATHEGLE